MKFSLSIDIEGHICVTRTLIVQLDLDVSTSFRLSYKSEMYITKEYLYQLINYLIN